jgi:hypothetical protein
MIGMLLHTIAQATNSSDPGRYRDLWSSGDWFDAVVMPFLDLLGAVFPLVAGVSIAGILFVYSGSPALPIVTLIIIGGSLIPFLPPEAQSAALILILLGIAWALYTAWMNTGQRL